VPHELFYWLAVPVTFASGTAVGDWTLRLSGWGRGRRWWLGRVNNITSLIPSSPASAPIYQAVAAQATTVHETFIAIVRLSTTSYAATEAAHTVTTS
jgi:hypothetical protein